MTIVRRLTKIYILVKCNFLAFQCPFNKCLTLNMIYSFAIGQNSMKKLRNSKVLVSGIGSVGVEICKNLILAGVRQVGIHDTKIATWRDLSAQV